MTTAAGVWAHRPASRAEAGPAQERAPIAFGLSVMIMLLFTQPWVVVQIEQAHADSLIAKVMFFPAYLAAIYLFLQRPWPAIVVAVQKVYHAWRHDRQMAALPLRNGSKLSVQRRRDGTFFRLCTQAHDEASSIAPGSNPALTYAMAYAIR